MFEEDPERGDHKDQAWSFDLRRYVEALAKYVWVIVALMALAITAAVIYTNRKPRIYEAQASVQIEPRLPDLLGQGQQDLLNIAVGATIDYYKQQRQVLASFSLVQQTVEQHRLYNALLDERERVDRPLEEIIDAATHRLRAMMKIKYPEQDRIMYVLVRSTNPRLAAEAANAHIATYEDYAKGLLSTDTKKASGALSTEFDDAENKLREAESALFLFQKDNDLLAVSLEERQSMVSSSINAYSTKLNEVRTERIELTARLNRMRQASVEDVLRSPILLMGNSTSFDSLRAQYYAERNKFIELDKEIGPKNPAYQMQKAKVDDLYSALQTEAQRMLAAHEEQLKAILATETALVAEVERATKEALALGPKIVAYNELNRRKKSVEDRYNILRGRLSTSELADRMNRTIDTTNVRPLDKALVPTRPVAPNLKVNIAIASVLSFLVGLGLVAFIVFLDRSIKTSEDAQQAAGVPVLGIIPMIDDAGSAGAQGSRDRDLFVHEHPTSAVAECCRSLRTNILFSAADRQAKTIVVSSANPQEGKTTSVIYLGTTMAQSGQRVLLIDTDMRRPRLHMSLGIPRQTGLSNLILGDTDYDEAIKTTLIPNLFVLPCGPLPPNPAELLMSQRFANVLTELSNRFDRLILDSPPLQVVADAVVLSKQADGCILVARASKTVRDDLKRSAGQLRNVEGTIFGVIVNAIEPDMRSGYYYTYYGYSEEPRAARTT
jgi:polysaccharide biosynthesis transport protein